MSEPGTKAEFSRGSCVVWKTAFLFWKVNPVLHKYAKRSTYVFCFTSSFVPKRANGMENLLTREIEAVGDDNVAEVHGPSPCSDDSRL